MSIYTLWESDDFSVSTPENPHIPYSEGAHIIVSPVREKLSAAWDDPASAGKLFENATQVCKIMADLKLSPWFNLQANGNWGLLPGGSTSFHIHIFGRNKTASWGKPLVLPESPGTYQNDPMPVADREKLSDALHLGLAQEL